ncbi:MAG: thiosulfate oxidation carrier protein SoxY [Magnetococcales bacterium]|nr:thiosulfate oxidation carrier protein SoxY [Magnetococcales bacterium]MBF0114759.1 thiosulfate oxidation carrier protein SoxY [Magnetococcales bacterium]
MDQTNVTRRGFFRTAGVLGAAVAGSSLLGVSVLAHADDAAPAVNIDELVAKQVGAGPIAMEKVGLDIPGTAENAALVRMPIVVDHPMEAGNFIQTVTLIIDNNPNPLIAQFELTPEAGKASLEFRARMAKSSKVRVIAKSNSGKLYGVVKEIQVAAGGCSG